MVARELEENAHVSKHSNPLEACNISENAM